MNEERTILISELFDILEDTMDTLKSRIHECVMKNNEYRRQVYKKAYNKYSALFDYISACNKNDEYFVKLTNLSGIFMDIPDISIFIKIHSPHFYVGDLQSKSINEYSLDNDYSLYNKIIYDDKTKKCHISDNDTVSTNYDLLIIYKEKSIVFINHIPKIYDFMKSITELVRQQQDGMIVDFHKKLLELNYFNKNVVKEYMDNIIF